MMNFKAIREDNYYYVDKTHFIEKMTYFIADRPKNTLQINAKHSNH